MYTRPSPSVLLLCIVYIRPIPPTRGPLWSGKMKKKKNKITIKTKSDGKT